MARILSVFCAATAILSPAQTTFKTLFSFQGSNGSNPGYYNLVQGTDGNLFGTTEVGGGTAEGTVFKFATTASKPTTLYKFCATGSLCPNGSKPYAGLVLASNGKFYGTTTLGGTTDNGTEARPLAVRILNLRANPSHLGQGMCSVCSKADWGFRLRGGAERIRTPGTGSPR